MEEIERLYLLDPKDISLKQLILDEKNNLNQLLETMELSITKIPKKYSKETLESLEKLLYSVDITEKITIYNVIKLIVEKQKNELIAN